MNYFSRKDENIIKAKENVRDVRRNHRDELNTLISNSYVYQGNLYPRIEEPNMKALQVVRDDTVGAIHKYVRMDPSRRCCALNFASYTRPGGLFLEGSYAQEESLCHHSMLFNVLNSFYHSYYEKNKEDMNKSLYQNKAIYTPDVIFDGVSKCDVITCAAPNKGNALTYGRASLTENTEALKSRIKYILQIADLKHCDTLIAGAFGCGVFQQNPYEVASIFMHEAIHGNHHPSTIVFAIPDYPHYRIFSEVLNQL